MLDKAGGQPRSAASVRAYQGQVCFQLHVAIGRASPSCYGPHFPFRGGAEVAPGGPEQKEPMLGPPSAGGSGGAVGTPKLSAGAEGSCSLPPRSPASALTPVTWLWQEGIASTVLCWSPGAKKEQSSWFLQLSLLTSSASVVSLGLNLHSAGQAAIHSLISRALALQV